MTRHNIGDAIPESIVIGETTREDVVRLLGEPDSASADGSVMVFGQSSFHGGLLFLVGTIGASSVTTFERVTSRRLIVRFGPTGVVSEATVEHKDCGGWEAVDNSESGPCLDVLGLGLTHAPQEPAALPTDEGEVIRYDADWYIDALRGGVILPRSGLLAFSDRSLIFLWRWDGEDRSANQKASPPLPLKDGVKIPYSQILQVELHRLGFGRHLVVSSTGGRFDWFYLGQTEQAAEELMHRLNRWRQAAGREPLTLVLAD